MNNLNSVLLEGKLVADPVLSYTGKGYAKVTLVVESNRWFKTEDVLDHEVGRFAVVVYGHQAEICEQYLKAGKEVRVVGRLRAIPRVVSVHPGTDPKGHDEVSWEDARFEIHAEHVEFKPERKVPEEPAAAVVSEAVDIPGAL